MKQRLIRRQKLRPTCGQMHAALKKPLSRFVEDYQYYQTAAGEQQHITIVICCIYPQRAVNNLKHVQC